MRATQGSGVEISLLIPAFLLTGCRTGKSGGDCPRLRVEERRNELYIAPEGRFAPTTLMESLMELLRVRSIRSRLCLDLSRIEGFDGRSLAAIIEALNRHSRHFQMIIIKGINEWFEAQQRQQQPGLGILGPDWNAVLSPDGLTLAKAPRRLKNGQRRAGRNG